MGKSGDQFLPAFRTHLDVEIADIPQPHKGTIVTEFEIDGKSQAVAFDVSDDPDFRSGAVDTSAITFKWQFRHGGYGDERIVPGGYIPVGLLMYRMLPYLRRLHAQWPRRYQVSGRFGGAFARDIRTKALDALSATDEFAFQGALGRVRYSKYLREIATSQVSVDLPGNGPLCFRLVEYLAVGACVVAYPHGCRLPVPLVDGEHLIYVRPDLSDLVERCKWCLDHPREARQMSTAASDYFDRYLHRDQLTAYYLHTLLERLA
jgi:hypothetical protein